MKIFQKILIITLLIISCLSLKIYADSDYIDVSKDFKGAVKVKSANIYKEDNSKSDKIKSLKFGKKVKIEKESDNWYQVIYNNVSGYMKKNDIVKYNKNKKHIALTFDDGPKTSTTSIILDALEKNNCRATFFIVGNNVNSKTKKLLQRELKLGCELGNHSYSHPNLSRMSYSKIRKQIHKTDVIIKKYTGVVPKLLRPPYGAINKKVSGATTKTKVLWTLDTLDWKYRNTNRLVSYINKKAKNNDIILMHDIHISTAKAVNKICKNLKKKNFEMVTVTELNAIKAK